MALVLLLLGGGTAAAQPDVEWTLTLGGDGDDLAHAVVQTSDGGYVVAGETGSSGAGGQDAWLIKISADGTEEWSTTYGGAEDDIAYDVRETADGGLIVAAETHSSGDDTASQSDFWLIKTDSSGEVEWSRTYDRVDLSEETESSDSDVSEETESSDSDVSAETGSSDPDVSEETEPSESDVPHAVRQTSDSGFIVAGSTNKRGQQDAWLVKTSADGSVEWKQEFGGDLDDNAYGVLEASGGGFVFVGKTDSIGAGGSDYWLVKTDALGTEEWSATFGGPYGDEARAVVEATDGGYVLGGSSWSVGTGLSDYWLVKTDSTGQREWDRSYGKVPRESAHALQQTSDGGFLLAGLSKSFPGGDHFWLVQTGNTGVELWSQAYGNPGAARSVQQTTDGGYILAGWTGPPDGARDARVIKTAAHDQNQPAPTAPVMVLENTGQSPITSAAVGFNIPGRSGPEGFFFDGSPLGEENPLPSGSQACTLPIAGTGPDTHLVTDQIISGGAGYIDEVTTSHSAPMVSADSDSFSFEFEQESAEDDEESALVAGSYQLVSSSPCQTAQAEFRPPVPVGLTIAPFPIKSGALDLEWDDSRSLGVVSYDVYVSLDPTGPFRRTATLVPESKYTHSGLVNGQSYYFAATAVDDRDRVSALSEVVEGVPFDLTPPQAPTGLTLESVDRTEGTARLTWSPNTEPDLKSYRVYRQDGDGQYQTVAALGRTNQHLDRSLPAEGGYTYVVTAVDQEDNESGHSNLVPPDLDFFGTINRVEPSPSEGGLLAVTTSRGIVEVMVTSETSIWLPYKSEASITDFVRGDKVAVTLAATSTESSTSMVVDKVYLIPPRTANRHVSGHVTALSDTQITVQPLDTDQEPIAFTISATTIIEWYQGTTELVEGSYVIVSTTSQPGSVGIPRPANVINVTSGRVPEDGTEATEPAVLATVRGVLRDINPETGNLVLETFELVLDRNTVIAEGLVAGDVVVIVAELRPDNSLLARSVTRDEQRDRVTEHTYVEGAYQVNRGPAGEWMVGGIWITVDHRTLTDGQPSAGQLVRVKAIEQDDGSLLARDVLNLPTAEDSGETEEITHLEGVFQEVNSGGAWMIGGVPVAVDIATSMEGSPSVGGRLAVEAVVHEGVVAARSLVSVERESVGEVRIRGAVDRVLDDGSLVVNGVTIALSALTELQIEAAAGDAVEIKALLTADGGLVARVVAASPGEDPATGTPINRVDIEGRVERVFRHGGLIVNGIRVVTSPLSVTSGEIVPGVRVQVRGLLQPNGSVLAREIRRPGSPSTEPASAVRVEGVLQRIVRDADGGAESLVLRGVTLTVDELTRFEPELSAGGTVLILAVSTGGPLLAVTVESQPVPRVLGNAEVQFQGTVESVQRDASEAIVSLSVHGIEVTLNDESRILGRLAAGETVEIKGVFEAGSVVAEEIKGAAQESVEAAPTPFELEGALETVIRDEDDNVVEVSVSGQTITVEILTVVSGELAVGSQVKIEGVIRDEELLAATITVTDGTEKSVSDSR